MVISRALSYSGFRSSHLPLAASFRVFWKPELLIRCGSDVAASPPQSTSLSCPPSCKTMCARTADVRDYPKRKWRFFWVVPAKRRSPDMSASHVSPRLKPFSHTRPFSEQARGNCLPECTNGRVRKFKTGHGHSHGISRVKAIRLQFANESFFKQSLLQN